MENQLFLHMPVRVEEMVVDVTDLDVGQCGYGAVDLSNYWHCNVIAADIAYSFQT